MAALERADKAIIRSRFSVRGYTFPDHKNGIGEALDIVAIFHSNHSFKLSLYQFTLRLSKYIIIFKILQHFLKFFARDIICSLQNIYLQAVKAIVHSVKSLPPLIHFLEDEQCCHMASLHNGYDPG